MALQRGGFAVGALGLLLAGCVTVAGEWEKTRKNDQTYSYEAFLRKYPKSEFADAARARLEELRFQAAVGERKIESLEKYIADNPASRYRTEAEQRLRGMHEANYRLAVAGGTIEDYEQYVNKYPKSPFVAEATGKLEDLLWADAQRRGTFGAYKAYRTKFPAGKYATEANAAIGPLKAVALAAESWSKGEAAESCRWICEAKACVDDIDKTLWSRLTENFGRIRNAGGTAFSWTQDNQYSCTATQSRGGDAIAFSTCIERSSGLRATVEKRGGDAELLSTTRIAPAAIARWQRSCE
jgi:hypothetical protein